MLFLAGAWQELGTGDTLLSAATLTLLGGGAATGSLLIARKAAPAIESSEEPLTLSEG